MIPGDRTFVIIQMEESKPLSKGQGMALEKAQFVLPDEHPAEALCSQCLAKALRHSSRRPDTKYLDCLTE